VPANRREQAGNTKRATLPRNPHSKLGAIEQSGKEPGKVTGESSFLTVNGKTYGFCGMVLLEIDEKPAACFGLHKPSGGNHRYTYLILFKPDPKSHRGSGVEGNEKESVIGSDGKIKCDLAATSAAWRSRPRSDTHGFASQPSRLVCLSMA
jgi:hypothetical protein